LQRIHLIVYSYWDDRELRRREEMLCCFLPAFQESTSLKELHMHLPRRGELSNLMFENMLTHTKSLWSLNLSCVGGHLENMAVAAARSGLKKNTSLRELTLAFAWHTMTISPMLTSLRDHPLLRRLCLHVGAIDLNGLEILLQSHTSKITELDIHRSDNNVSPRIIGLAGVLQALARRPTLTILGLHCCPLDQDEARLLWLAFQDYRLLF
jgi:hypothetical protein